MSISIVITSFNRRHCIYRAILSALSSFPSAEIIVVDDASSDNTAEYVFDKFMVKVNDGNIVIVALVENVGVTGAKNLGYARATKDWVIFLDSDDELIPASGALLSGQLNSNVETPIIFFRCINPDGCFVGELIDEDMFISLKNYLIHSSYGEALTVINKKLIGNVLPYLSELRGYEGLGCCRLIRDFGPALLSRHVGRIYYETGSDRLSVSNGFMKRILLLSKGHWMIVTEFSHDMGLFRSFIILGKAATYFILGHIYNISQRFFK